MADEQAQAEATAIEETQVQTTATQTSGSEAATNPGESTDRGDLSIALKQSREEKRALEEQLNNPQFVYQKARELGLTEEEAQTEVNAVTPPKADGYGQYKYYREIELSQEKYPQLTTDKDDQLAVTAIMNANGLSPLQAADRYYSKMNKTVEAAKAEGAKAKESTITAKEQASTVTNAVTTDSDASEYDALVKRSRDYRDPKAADKAHLDLIRWKESHR